MTKRKQHRIVVVTFIGLSAMLVGSFAEAHNFGLAFWLNVVSVVSCLLSICLESEG